MSFRYLNVDMIMNYIIGKNKRYISNNLEFDFKMIIFSYGLLMHCLTYISIVHVEGDLPLRIGHLGKPGNA